MQLNVELSEEETRIYSYITPIAQWLGSANSCINPILYAFFNKKFRNGFIAVVKSRSCCGQLRSDIYSQSTVRRSNYQSATSYSSNLSKDTSLDPIAPKCPQYRHTSYSEKRLSRSTHSFQSFQSNLEPTRTRYQRQDTMYNGHLSTPRSGGTGTGGALHQKSIVPKVPHCPLSADSFGANTTENTSELTSSLEMIDNIGAEEDTILTSLPDNKNCDNESRF